MQSRKAVHFVSAFLPALALAFTPGCGGGGSEGPAASAAAGATAPPAQTVTNQAPTISGETDAYARVGDNFDYQPVAADPDGDALSFSATNLPPWAAIDPATGRLSGTPTSGDVGMHESITIVAADRSHRAITSPFTITVLAPAGGMATLQWEAPGSKVDGSPLDDLAGYRILYGRSADDLDHSVFVADPSVTSYDFSALDGGIWYFAVIGVNAEGLEGPPTIPAMKSI